LGELTCKARWLDKITGYSIRMQNQNEFEYINPNKILEDLLPKFNRRLRKDINLILYKHKLSYLQWVIVLKASKLTTITDVAQDLGISETLASRYILKLEKLNILTSDLDYSDNKFKVICISNEFKPTFEKVQKQINHYFHELLKVLSYSEMISFGEIMYKLNGEYFNYVNSILGIPQSSVPN